MIRRFEDLRNVKGLVRATPGTRGSFAWMAPEAEGGRGALLRIYYSGSVLRPGPPGKLVTLSEYVYEGETQRHWEFCGNTTQSGSPLWRLNGRTLA
jgi:hypothetical protein